MSRLARAGAILGLLLAGARSVPAAAASRSTRLDVDLDFSTRYDSNVLRYSDEDRAAFLRRNPASRFAIRTLDDAVFRTSASVSVSRPVIGRRASRLRYTYTTSRHGQNPVDDYEAHAVSLRQPILRNAWVTIRYSQVPSNYVRHLWDEDLASPYRFYPRYQPASFRSDRLSIQTGLRLGPDWSAWARADVRWLDYNAAFDERDGTSREGSAEVSWSGWRPVTIGLEPSFVDRRADGTDPSHPAVPDSLRDDVSYRGGGVAVDALLPEGELFRRAPRLDVELSVLRKKYTSKREADVYHHGRRDTVLGLDVDVEKTVRSGAALFALYEFERARSSGTNPAGARGDVASFDVWRIGGGIRLSWSGRLP